MREWILLPWLLYAGYQDLHTRTVDITTIATVWSIAVAVGHPYLPSLLFTAAVMGLLWYIGLLGDADAMIITALTYAHGWGCGKPILLLIFGTLFSIIIYYIRRRKEVEGITWVFHTTFPLLPGLVPAYLLTLTIP